MPYPLEITSPETLALALSQARLVSGLSQRELAERVGTSVSTIQRLESGADSRMITLLLSILAETGTTVTIAIPEGEPKPARPEVEYTPEQLAERAVEAARHHEVVERSRAEGLFNTTRLAP